MIGRNPIVETHNRERKMLLIRFVLAGITNTAFGYFVFAALILVGGRPFWALLGSMIAGVMWNFWTSSRFVFRDIGGGRAMRFIGVYAVVLSANWLSLRIMQSLGVVELLAQAVLAVPLAVISYLGQRFFVFNHGDVRG